MIVLTLINKNKKRVNNTFLFLKYTLHNIQYVFKTITSEIACVLWNLSSKMYQYLRINTGAKNTACMATVVDISILVAKSPKYPRPVLQERCHISPAGQDEGILRQNTLPAYTYQLVEQSSGLGLHAGHQVLDRGVGHDAHGDEAGGHDEQADVTQVAAAPQPAETPHLRWHASETEEKENGRWITWYASATLEKQNGRWRSAHYFVSKIGAIWRSQVATSHGLNPESQ